MVGETQPVPFVTAFVREDLDDATEQQILLALMTAGTKPELLVGLETLAGFVPWDDESASGGSLKKRR